MCKVTLETFRIEFRSENQTRRGVTNWRPAWDCEKKTKMLGSETSFLMRLISEKNFAAKNVGSEGKRVCAVDLASL